jgi:outer membrane lipoprotein-sorting protein
VKYWRHPRRATNAALSVWLIGWWAAAPVCSQPAPTAAAAGSAEALLERFTTEVRDLSARFEQSRFDPDGQPIDEAATGRFSLLRPDRFLWHQQLPFEQVFDADGEYLWEYDVEFAQVTRQPLSELAATPAMLLSGEGRVGDDYVLRLLPAAGETEWLELTPADGVAGDFESARIAFAAGVPVALELVDGLGNLTQIEFYDIEVNTGLDPAVFAFEPPAGVHIDGID